MTGSVKFPIQGEVKRAPIQPSGQQYLFLTQASDILPDQIPTLANMTFAQMDFNLRPEPEIHVSEPQIRNMALRFSAIHPAEPPIC
jgi:hypothetical protein